MTDNAVKVFEYLKANAKGNDLTTKDIAEATGVSVPGVTGTVNGLVKKGLAYREEVPGENEKGKAIVTKYIRLNDEAYDWDPDAK